MKACEEREGFAATETLSTGAIKAEARIRYRRPGKITLEYRTYEDPLVQFEERYAGSQFIPSELLEMQIVYNGRGTWLYDVKRNVAIRKLGRRLYSPLRLPDGIAEIDLMCDLTHNFLLRDEGKEKINGKDTIKIGLKPKSQERMSLMKNEIFPVKKATICIDEETLFPVRISFYPSQRSPLYYIAGPSTPITIDYNDLLPAVPDEDLFSFTPPEGVRVFHEEEVGEKGLEERLPFALSLDHFTKRGYELYDKRGTVTANVESDRAYVFLSFTQKKQNAEDKKTRSLSLHVGNYLSLSMNRRRALLADSGEEIDLAGVRGKIIDRSALLGDEIPAAVRRQIHEISWQQGEVYWFLLGEQVDKDDLVGIATALASGET